VAETVLTIPTHQWLSEKDRRAIAELFGDVSTRKPLAGDVTERIARSAGGEAVSAGCTST